MDDMWEAPIDRESAAEPPPAPTPGAAAPATLADDWSPPPPLSIAGLDERPPPTTDGGPAVDLQPPHPALASVDWQGWPGYAERPVPPAATSRTASGRGDDVESGESEAAARTTAWSPPIGAAASAATDDATDHPIPPRLPAPTAGAGATSGTAAAAPQPPQRRRRSPIWGWAAAALVGLVVGLIVAPQRTDDSDLLTGDGSDEFDDDAVAPVDPSPESSTATSEEPSEEPSVTPSTSGLSPAPTVIVAQLPPAPATTEPSPVSSTVVEPVPVSVSLTIDFAGGANEESIRLTNDGDEPVDVTGWQASDDGRQNVYVFSPLVLPAGGSVTLTTGCGPDSETQLFWCALDEVWNDAGDAATIVGADGRLIATAAG